MMAQSQQCTEASPPAEMHNLLIDRFELATPRSSDSGASPHRLTPRTDSGLWFNFVDNTFDTWAKVLDKLVQASAATETEEGAVLSIVAKGNEAPFEAGAVGDDAKLMMPHHTGMTASTALLLRAKKEKAKADVAKQSQTEKIPETSKDEEITPAVEPRANPSRHLIVEAAYTTWVAPITVASTNDKSTAYSKKPAAPSASKAALPSIKVEAPKKIEEPGTSAPGCFCFVGRRKIK